MKRIGFLAALSSVFILFGAQSAFALNDFCDSVTGSPGTGLCQITTVHNPATGSFTYDRNVEITGTGALVTGAGGITMEVLNGDFVMDSGALIDGNVNGGACPGKGGDITITLDNGDLDLKTGSTVRSDSCQGGAIKITTTATHTADIDGTVESVGSESGTGGVNQKPGGGTITIIAGCSLTVSDSGVVSSRGKDPGADLVHLEGCAVLIDGLVESTGPGHVKPQNPPNHCNANNSVHPLNSMDTAGNTACVEIWSGTTVIIDSTPPHNGQVNADVGQSGGPQGRGWIDIYANGNISIIGDTVAPFAVHANGGIGVNTDDGGYITIKSLGGDVSATGLAVQADATSAGSIGGDMHIEAFNNVNFNGATNSAQGDSNPTGGFGKGGKEGTSTAPIRAFQGALTWTSGVGNVLPTGNLATLPAGNRGVIFLQGCGAPTLGASFPFLGAAATTPTTSATCAAAGVGPIKGTPGALPIATCQASFCGGNATKSGTKFNDKNGNGIRDAGEPGLPNWVIKAFDSSNVLAGTATTDASGNYLLTLAPGSYTVCEVPQATWVQTCPKGPIPNGFDCNGNPATVADCSALTGPPATIGYAITLVTGQSETGNDFGNNTTNLTCQKQTTITIMNQAFPGNLGPDITVKAFPPFNESVQAAVDNASDVNGDGYIIIMVIAHADGSLGGTVNQNVIVSKDYSTDPNPKIANKPFGLFGCSVTMTGGGAGPAVWVQNTAKGKQLAINGHQTTILVADLHGGNSAVGDEADGTLRYFRNIEPSGNGTGILVVGDGNTVHNGVVQHSSGVGLQITGSSNFVTDPRVYTSGSHGVQVTGNSNQLLKMLLGDIGKGNGADGLNVAGSNNVLQENVTRSNTNDGVRIPSGTANTLFKNTSGGTPSQDNGDCEFEVVAGNTNLGQNTANGVTVPGAVPGPFPTGCIGTP